MNPLRSYARRGGIRQSTFFYSLDVGVSALRIYQWHYDRWSSAKTDKEN